MVLDMTVTMGNVLTIATMIGGLFMVYVAIRERLVRIETQLGPLWSEYTERRVGDRRAGGPQ